MGVREVMGRNAPDQRFGQFARREALEVAPQFVDETETDLIGNNLVVEDPLPGLGDRDRLGQQVVHLDDFDPAIAHLLHEIEVIALGVFDPQDVVK